MPLSLRAASRRSRAKHRCALPPPFRSFPATGPLVARQTKARAASEPSTQKRAEAKAGGHSRTPRAASHACDRGKPIGHWPIKASVPAASPRLGSWMEGRSAAGATNTIAYARPLGPQTVIILPQRSEPHREVDLAIASASLTLSRGRRAPLSHFEARPRAAPPAHGPMLDRTLSLSRLLLLHHSSLPFPLPTG